MKLYEIQKNYLEALSAFTDPDAEIPPEVVADTLEAIEGEFEAKAINVAAFLRGMEKEAEAIEEAEKQMAKRRKSLEARARWLRDYIKIGMQTTGQREIRSPWFVLKVTNNPAAVDITDPDAIPAEFMRTPEPPPPPLPVPDKTAIKDALTAGREVPGARLVTGTRLAIK